MPLLPYDYLHLVNCPEVVTISDNYCTAQQPGNSQKTFYQTFGTSGRPTWYRATCHVGNWVGLALVWMFHPSCPATQPLLPNSHQPKQNLAQWNSQNQSTQLPTWWVTLYRATYLIWTDHEEHLPRYVPLLHGPILWSTELNTVGSGKV